MINWSVCLAIADRVSIADFSWTWSDRWFWPGTQLWQVFNLCMTILLIIVPLLDACIFVYIYLFIAFFFTDAMVCLDWTGAENLPFLLQLVVASFLFLNTWIFITSLGRLRSSIEASDMSSIEAVISCDEERLRLEKEAEALAGQVCLSG